MARILLVYGTVEGQTARISQVLCTELRQLGNQVDIFSVQRLPPGLDLDSYDAVMAGGAVHASTYPRPLQKWLKRNSSRITAKPGAFFSVCLGILEKNPALRGKEKRIAQNLFDKTGWHPSLSTVFAGALAYTRYSWMKRWMMKQIAARSGGDTDTTRDHEYTNWDEVKAFARKFSFALRERPFRKAASY